MTHTLTDLLMGTAPTVIDETKPFWEGTLKGELLVQVCNECGTKQLPGGPCCTTCLSQDLSWQKASGRATLFTFTVVHHAFHPAFADKVPYVVADVQLEEGPIITSTVTDVPLEQITIGMPLQVWFDEPIEDAFHVQLALPKFRGA